MKIFNLLLAVMFVVFAFLQLNDPDPVIWISIYGAVAVTCVLAAFRRYYIPAYIVLLIVYIAYSFVYLPSELRWLHSDDKAMLFDNLAKMQNLYIEESREYMGLVICMLVTVMHLVMAVVRKRKAFN